MNITELIEKVREIDEESADYLEGDAKKLPDYDDEGYCYVSNLFYWADSPQGHEHWNTVNELLREINQTTTLRHSIAEKVKA